MGNWCDLKLANNGDFGIYSPFKQWTWEILRKKSGADRIYRFFQLLLVAGDHQQEMGYPLVMTNSLLLKSWPIEIVDLPIKDSGSYHSFFVTVCRSGDSDNFALIANKYVNTTSRWTRQVVEWQSSNKHSNKQHSSRYIHHKPIGKWRFEWENYRKTIGKWRFTLW